MPPHYTGKCLPVNAGDVDCAALAPSILVAQPLTISPGIDAFRTVPSMTSFGPIPVPAGVLGPFPVTISLGLVGGSIVAVAGADTVVERLSSVSFFGCKKDDKKDKEQAAPSTEPKPVEQAVTPPAPEPAAPARVAEGAMPSIAGLPLRV